MSKVSAALNSIPKIASKVWFGLTTTVGSVVVFSFVFLLVIGAFSTQLARQTTLSQKLIQAGNQEQVIAVVRVTGVIVDDVDSSNPLAVSSSAVSSRDLIEVLDELDKNDQVKAIVLRINSPGGSVVATDEVFQKIISLRDSKPVVASLGDVAASGGYYLAAASDQIIANPATLTGSIGVIMELPKLAELYDKLGVEMRTIQSGEYKDMGSSARDLSAQEQTIFQNLIDEAYQQFVAAIAQGRDMEPEQILSYADGRIFSGKQALEHHLIDQLGTQNSAIEVATQLAGIENPSVIEYTQENFLDSLLGAKIQLKLDSLLPAAKSLQSSSPQLYYLYSL